jgi:RNA polymerase sigma factor (sigma-70 family)
MVSECVQFRFRALDARLETTNWSVVLAAGRSDSPQARLALGVLCETYWYPVYAFLRRQGCAAEDARDLAQGYFLHLLEKDSLRGIRPEAGRFRSFLLVSVRNFLSNALDRERALKRGGGATPIPLETSTAEERYRDEPADAGLPPDRLYERQWALTVLAQALAALRREFAASGDAARFDVLRPYLTGEESALPYREAAAQLKLSESAVKVAVHRLRRRFGDALRAVVARTLADPGDVDDEIRAMLVALAPLA